MPLPRLTTEEFQRNLWRSQPRWARLYEAAFGIPAWLFLMVRMFTAQDPLATAMAVKIAIGLFVSAALLQLTMFIRAFWKMDV